MRGQFDSCSYNELTSCVHARIEWIRESRKFLKDPVSRNYPHVSSKQRLNVVINSNEIKRLLKYRRILKKSNLRNFDSDYHLSGKTSSIHKL